MAETPSPPPPLEGLRIIDVSTYVAGPSGGMTLAHLGADVIRVDPIGGATDVRRLPLDAKGNSLYWAGLNKGKRSVEVDTSSPAGRELVARLIGAPGDGGGILLTNAVGQRWLSFEELQKVRPDVIVVHITGRSDGKPAVDYTVNCEVGLPLITGPADLNRPVNHVLPAWDLLTGMQAALGILAAERARARTGRGQHLTISLADVAVATMGHLGFVADVVVNGVGRLRDGNYLYGSFGNDFRTRDNRRVMVVALTDRHWQKLVEMTGVAGAIAALEQSLGIDLGDENTRFLYRQVLAALVAPWFGTRTYDEVTAALEASHILWGPYRTVEELVRDPESLLHVGDLMEDVEHPGIGTFPTPRSTFQVDGWDGNHALPAPVLGQHTDEVLQEVLGLGGDEIAHMRDEGVVGGALR
jgi:2-methylfumaryl-CoA isomerase